MSTRKTNTATLAFGMAYNVKLLGYSPRLYTTSIIHTYLCLFNILPANYQPDSERQRKGESQEWLQLSLLTARRCLTRHWIRATTPTIQEQQMDLQNFLRLERLDTDISGYKNTSVQNTLRKRWYCFMNSYLDEET